jgi:hypothetical protein
MRAATLLLLVVSASFYAVGGTNSNPRPSLEGMPSEQRHQALTFTTAAYRKEALRLVIEEANRVAGELELPEPRPITEANLVESFICRPGIAQMLGAVGSITTSNYNYYVSVGNKFSYLVRTHLDQEYGQLKARYRWPTSRINTNAAYQLATQWLAAASMDVAGLNRDCQLSIIPWTPEGDRYKFVPLYTVRWFRGDDVFAMVELFQPTRTLRQMHVEKPQYILRTLVTITNVDYLLSQTNGLAKPGRPLK